MNPIWWLYSIFLSFAFLGELFTKSTKYGFIINPISFSIYQSIIWLIFWLTCLIISGIWFEPSPLSKLLIFPWTIFLFINFILPSNIIGSIIANILKRSFRKIKEE